MVVSVPMVRAVVEVVELAGVPRARLLQHAGLDESRILDGSGTFELDEFSRLQESAIELTGNEGLGLQMA